MKAARHLGWPRCATVRDDASVPSPRKPDPRPHTKTYSQEARERLGLAVVRAREAAGYTHRPALSDKVGISVRSIVKLEQGDPVGPPVYEAVARALPHWDVTTPKAILEGAAAPPLEGEVTRERSTIDIEPDENFTETVRKVLAPWRLQPTPAIIAAMREEWRRNHLG